MILLASKEEKKQRLDICKKCEFVKNKVLLRCGKCECLLNLKTKLKEVVCPIGKW